jgi:hypothetical protein
MKNKKRNPAKKLFVTFFIALVFAVLNFSEVCFADDIDYLLDTLNNQQSGDYNQTLDAQGPSSSSNNQQSNKKNHIKELRQKGGIELNVDFGFEGDEFMPTDDSTVIYSPEDLGAVAILTGYLSPVFIFLISLSIIFAVLKVMYGGFHMILKSSAGEIAEGRKHITEALVALAAIFSTAMVLNFINPDFFTF